MEAKRQRRHDHIALYLERQGASVGEIISLQEREAQGPFIGNVSREKEVAITYTDRRVPEKQRTWIFGGSLEELVAVAAKSLGHRRS